MQRVSGVTIVRGARTHGYPVEESIRSLLPAVDELIVNVGDLDDGTWEAVTGIGDSRIQAFHSVWDLGLRAGRVLSEETNKALARCRGDWAVYLQSDEVLHEDDLPVLRKALARHATGPVNALVFRYYHFYGSYWAYQDDPRRWYRYATRAVRTNVGIVSVGDACAFERHVDGRTVAMRHAVPGVRVFHYGRARPLADAVRKQRNLDRLFLGAQGDDPESLLPPPEDFRDRRHLRRFVGRHPAVMQDCIARAEWPQLRAPFRWYEWVRRAHVYAAWLTSTASRRMRRALSGNAR